MLRLSAKGRAELALRVSEPAARAALESADEPDDAGWSRATLPIVSIDDARLELLQLGAEVIVEEPAELRLAIAETARSIGRLYG